MITILTEMNTSPVETQMIDTETFAVAKQIGDAVISGGDEAVIGFSRQFDRLEADPFSLEVSRSEIEEARNSVPSDLLDAFEKAKKNIEDFHRHQLPKNWSQSTEDITQGFTFRALDSVGLYVPGGRASYPSTVLMNAIPAKLAGVKRLVMVTPPRPDGTLSPAVLAAADCCGVDTIYKTGGAQAVFALAYGTETIQRVDKIVGPGNRFVTAAKQQVYGLVDIDKPAGPSEVLVYVEDIAYAAVAAAELLAQLEHDPDAIAVGVSPDKAVLDAVNAALSEQLIKCDRKAIIEDSIKNSSLFLVKDRTEGLAVINKVASEHLVLMVDDAKEMMKQVRHAGSIFLGPYTPVALGDYFAGPNHVLPTAGAARYSSPLGVMDFMKYSSYLSYSKSALAAAQPYLKTLTDSEGFDAHYKSVTQRLS